MRERVAEQYAAPFDAIFDSPDAIAELGEVDWTRAAASLLGPIVLGKFSMLTNFDYREGRLLGGGCISRDARCSKTFAQCMSGIAGGSDRSTI